MRSGAEPARLFWKNTAGPPPLAQCQHRAARCLAQAAALARQARVAQRWQAALPALLAAAQQVPPAAEDAARAAAHAAWLHYRARPLDVAAATRWHLLRAQAAGLLAEAAALG